MHLAATSSLGLCMEIDDLQGVPTSMPEPWRVGTVNLLVPVLAADGGTRPETATSPLPQRWLEIAERDRRACISEHRFPMHLPSRAWCMRSVPSAARLSLGALLLIVCKPAMATHTKWVTRVANGVKA